MSKDWLVSGDLQDTPERPDTQALRVVVAKLVRRASVANWDRSVRTDSPVRRASRVHRASWDPRDPGERSAIRVNAVGLDGLDIRDLSVTRDFPE